MGKLVVVQCILQAFHTLATNDLRIVSCRKRTIRVRIDYGYIEMLLAL
jgi:uncharacterized DUF497 family protein